MAPKILGLHHVTAAVDEAQPVVEQRQPEDDRQPLPLEACQRLPQRADVGEQRQPHQHQHAERARELLAKLALNNGIGGPLEAPSAYLMKSPPKQIRDDEAREDIERFIVKNAAAKSKAAAKA